MRMPTEHPLGGLEANLQLPTKRKCSPHSAWLISTLLPSSISLTTTTPAPRPLANRMRTGPSLCKRVFPKVSTSFVPAPSSAVVPTKRLSTTPSPRLSTMMRKPHRAFSHSRPTTETPSAVPVTKWLPAPTRPFRKSGTRSPIPTTKTTIPPHGRKTATAPASNRSSMPTQIKLGILEKHLPTSTATEFTIRP